MKNIKRERKKVGEAQKKEKGKKKTERGNKEGFNQTVPAPLAAAP